ncbi:Fic family protein [Sulfurivirga sp.]|uniref:Fic family protein n=1 Tax=Sulfurivirga sp. TaxID=2614236 RepID=UPI0025E863A6|nr:Fic family protein [Sulfurivirga sp.]
MQGAAWSAEERYAEWCSVFRARSRVFASTSDVNPVLTEDEEAVINRVWLELQEEYCASFLSIARQRASLFAQPCYFLNRALRFPVWVRLHDLLFACEWSGRLRDYDLSKGYSCDEFCPAVELSEAGHRVMALLRQAAADWVCQPNRPALVAFLVKMHTYLNYVHPFVDGNGRVQRLYMNLIAAYFGYLVDWRQANREAYLDAVRAAFRSEEEPLAALIDQHLRPVTDMGDFK